MKIVMSAALAAFLFIGCGSDDSSEVVAEVKAPVEKKVAVVVAPKEEVSSKTDEALAKAQELSDTTIAKTKEIASKVSDSTVETTKEVVAKAQELSNSTIATSKDAYEKAKNVTADAYDKAKKMALGKTGEELYKVCSSCHGATAEKSALGKSQIIQGWSSQRIEEAIHGYKNGTYGGQMKAIMKGQTSKLSDSEVKTLAEHISKF